MTGVSFFKRLLRLGEPASAAQAPPEEPTPTFNFDDERIPKVARERVTALRSQLVALEGRAAQKASAQELAELRQIATVYLPKLLQSYIEIPSEHRAEIYRQTGRSASYALCDRLDKIAARLDELSSQLARNDLEAFHQNMRFIDMRFGSSPFDL
jgi:hypothetical protein